MAYDAKAPSRIVPATVAAVMTSEMMNARGKFVRLQACAKPSTLGGAGTENALPSTAWAVVLKAIVTVTYKGTITVSEQRASTSVSDQLTPPMRCRNTLRRGVACVTAGFAVGGLSCWVDIRARSFLASPRAEAGRVR